MPSKSVAIVEAMRHNLVFKCGIIVPTHARAYPVCRIRINL
jgi:hypothetical protein